VHADDVGEDCGGELASEMQQRRATVLVAVHADELELPAERLLADRS
jgi:hypothetical protein